MGATCNASLCLGPTCPDRPAPGCAHRRCAATPQRAGLTTRTCRITLHLLLASQLVLSNKMRCTRPPPTHRCRINIYNSLAYSCIALQVIQNLKIKATEGRGACDAGICNCYKTESRFCACTFSNPLMSVPLGYHRVKYQRGALH